MRRFVHFMILLSVVAAGSAAADEQSLSLFVGNTDDRGEDAFSLGLAYEYRFSELLGVGGFVDHAGGDVRTGVVGVPVFLHPVAGLLLLAAPGIEHQVDGGNEFLFRLGLGWEFELGERWVITPVANVDFVDSEEVYVYGIEFSYRFGGG